jgi:hypothetical protein
VSNEESGDRLNRYFGNHMNRVRRLIARSVRLSLKEMEMKRLLIFLTGVFVAALPATSTQAETTTLILEGQIFCASNGIDVPPPFTCLPDLAVVDPSIRPGSPFEVTVTLPIVNPLPGTPAFYFPNQTIYVVPRTGEINMSGVVGGLPFSFEEFVPYDNLPPAPGIDLGEDLLVLVADNESFALPNFRLDQWQVGAIGSSMAITSVPNQVCTVSFGKGGFEPNTDEELGNIVSQDYFVPDSLEGPVVGWDASFECSFFDLFQHQRIQFFLRGFVTQLTVVVDIDLKPGSDPNCINPNAGGRTSVAILSSENFDAQSVDTDSLEFGGALAERCGLEDIKPKDGILDLACRYKVSEVEFPAADSDCGEVGLTGLLVDGTAIEGSDVACLRGEATCEARPTR